MSKICLLTLNCTRYVKITVHFIKYEENISDFNIIYREPISEPNFSKNIFQKCNY